MVLDLLDMIDSIMYYPVLIIVMTLTGLYFTVLTKGVQIRLSDRLRFQGKYSSDFQLLF